MIETFEKKTAYKKAQDERDRKMLARYISLLEDGYMKMQAYKAIGSEFGLYSVAGVYKAIARAKSIVEDENKENI